jgi:hypothetical protein
MAIEIPSYQVLVHQNGFELREYDQMTLATVKVNSNDFMDSINRGFRPLADYIFGNNTLKTDTDSDVSQKIAMTAPVTSSIQDDGTYKVAFTMPQSYSIKSLPNPNNKDVTHENVKSHKVCVVRFSGRPNEGIVQEKIGQLKDWADQKGYKLQGKPTLSIYNPPWRPGFLRRNEISITVKN